MAVSEPATVGQSSCFCVVCCPVEEVDWGHHLLVEWLLSSLHYRKRKEGPLDALPLVDHFEGRRQCLQLRVGLRRNVGSCDGPNLRFLIEGISVPELLGSFNQTRLELLIDCVFDDYPLWPIAQPRSAIFHHKLNC